MMLHVLFAVQKDNTVSFSFILFFYLTRGHFFIAYTERRRETEKHQCEGETLISRLLDAPRLGIKLTTCSRALSGIKPSTFQLRDDAPTH